jgi:hypothetical protein
MPLPDAATGPFCRFYEAERAVATAAILTIRHIELGAILGARPNQPQ